LGLATDLIRVRAIEGGRVALHSVPERVAQVDALLVGQTELLSELVDTLLCQDVPFVAVRSVSVETRSGVVRG